MSKGLAGAVVAETELSMVDGAKGELLYVGYNILDLGRDATYEEVVYLLWNGKLPNQAELSAFSAEMAAQRELPSALTALLYTIPTNSHPMAVLRTAISYAGNLDADADNLETDAVKAKALNLVGMLPTIVAAWERIRTGKEPIAPRSDLGQAANFLYMMSGEEPNAAAVKALDAYLVMLADHGFNASTFAARVTFATITDVYSAITSAIGTLKGDSHGGANQRAMEQFEEAHNSESVEHWYNEARAAKRRIMGIGHRVYKVLDPRATILGPMAEKVADNSGEGHWFDIANEIYELTRADAYFVERNLYPNVDYYSSIVLYMVGIPMDQMTSAFAMSRIVGWTSHIIEQLANNRLIRPKAHYVGPRDLDWAPLETR